MSRTTNQVIQGKAFEYALLYALWERLHENTQVEIVASNAYNTALAAHHKLTENEQTANALAASFAINFLIDLEPRLSYELNKDDILQLDIVSDKKGQSGDVRDVLAIRLLQKWEIGISAKHNHKAVKHPRLSPTIDFAEQWLGLACSPEYLQQLKTILEPLKSIRKKSNRTATWESLGDYHTSIYKPILDAFIGELKRLDEEHPNVVASRLVGYLIGNHDFYKVINLRGRIVEIQAYNLRGSLNQSIGSHRPKAKVPLLRLPKMILDIRYAKDSNSTIHVTMDEGWQMSFRIHNASSRIEPSLKFDINLISAPHTLFKNQLFLPAQNQQQ